MQERYKQVIPLQYINQAFTALGIIWWRGGEEGRTVPLHLTTASKNQPFCRKKCLESYWVLARSGSGSGSGSSFLPQRGSICFAIIIKTEFQISSISLFKISTVCSLNRFVKFLLFNSIEKLKAGRRKVQNNPYFCQFHSYWFRIPVPVEPTQYKIMRLEFETLH